MKNVLLVLLCSAILLLSGSGGGGSLATAQEAQQVADLLSRLDSDEDGYVTRDEFKALLRREKHHYYRTAYEASVEHLHEYFDHEDAVAHVLEKHDDNLHGAPPAHPHMRRSPHAHPHALHSVFELRRPPCRHARGHAA